MSHKGGKLNMDNWASVSSAWLLTVALIYAGITDLIIYIFGLKTPSVSWYVQNTFSKFPIITLAAGILIGHLAWGIAPPPDPNGSTGLPSQTAPPQGPH